MCPAYENSAIMPREALECRLSYAARAQGDLSSEQLRDFCSAAGPTGRSQTEGAVCETDSCVPYCAFMSAFCSDNLFEETFELAYPSSFTCIDDCQDRRARDPAFDNLDYRVNAEGDSLQCRVYHVTNSSLSHSLGDRSEALTHCGHAAGVGPCSGLVSSAAATPAAPAGSASPLSSEE